MTEFDQIRALQFAQHELSDHVLDEHDSLLMKKLLFQFKYFRLDKDVQTRCIKIVLFTSNFDDIAQINSFEQSVNRTVAFNVTRDTNSFLTVPHSIVGTGHVVMPVREVDDRFVCLAIEPVLDNVTDQYFLVFEVHKNKLIRDFKLRTARTYSKFAFVTSQL